MRVKGNFLEMFSFSKGETEPKFVSAELVCEFVWTRCSLIVILPYFQNYNIGLYCVLCVRGSVVGIVTGYRLDGPGIESRWGARFSALVQTGPGAHPASCTMGTGFFPGVKSGRSVTLTPQPLLVPWSRKGRAIPLLPLWAVRPVQSLSACTVELYLYSPYGPYGLYRASVPVQ
jgi:hypothetical protein